MDCSEDETAIRYEKDEIVIARNIFDQTTPQVFGEIDDDHPLYVVSLLHTNGVGN